MGGSHTTKGESVEEVVASTTTDSALVTASGVPVKGLLLWLDASRSVTLSGGKTESGEALVKKWESVGGPSRELVSIPHRLRLKRHVKPSSPYVVEGSGPFGQSGIQTDYLHTFGIRPPIRNIQTICSVHYFNQKLKHTQVFETTQDRGTWCNFYLFCARDFGTYPFHTDGATNEEHSRHSMTSGHSAPGYRDSVLSLDCEAAIGTAKTRHWTEPKIAILECSQRVSAACDQIGAERQCHHFSGVIHELIVFDRKLTAEETEAVQLYFVKKYYGSGFAAIREAIDLFFESAKLQQFDELPRIIASFVIPLPASVQSFAKDIFR